MKTRSGSRYHKTMSTPTTEEQSANGAANLGEENDNHVAPDPSIVLLLQEMVRDREQRERELAEERCQREEERQSREEQLRLERARLEEAAARREEESQRQLDIS